MAIGAPVQCDILRSEGDTDDLPVNLNNEDGTAKDLTNWTATLAIGASADEDAGAELQVLTGTGSGNVIPIDMNAFSVAKGCHFYNVRLVDPGGDTPGRIYFFGAFDVAGRIGIT